MPDENRYDDIIAQPHPTSKRHPRMSRLNRAAQFAPFAALTGYGDAIAEAARQTGDQRELTDAERLALGEKLSTLRDRLADSPTVTVTYFRPDPRKAGGEYTSVTGNVRRVREYERELYMADGTIIPFDRILDIDGEWIP